MAPITESDYKTAQESNNPRIRQEFLNTINLEDTTEFVKEIKYNPQDKMVRAHFLASRGDFELPMFASHRTSEKFVDNIYAFFKMRRKRSTLYVYPELFKQSYGFFLSSLIDHEGQHAKQSHIRFRDCMKNWKLIDNSSYEQEPYFVSLTELPAVANQIAKAEKRKLEPGELEQIRIRYRGHLHNFLQLSGDRTSKRYEDLTTMLCDSEGDQLIREKVLPKIEDLFVSKP